MRPSSLTVRLSWLIAALALCAAAVGLFYPATGSAFAFAGVRGDTVQIYGQGLYRYDTPVGATGFMAADVITLVVAIPLLIVAALRYRRGSFAGGLLLCGALSYFLYNYGSMAFGAAYNNLFLVYAALLWANLWALIPALLSFELAELPARFGPGLPRRGISLFLIVSGVILMLVWLVISIIPALVRNTAPLEARYYTTFTTGVIDLALVAPALLTAGILLRRRTPAGYLLAATLLIFTCVLGANLIAGGVLQLRSGVISPGQATGLTLPFAILTLFALGFTARLFRNITRATS